MFVLLQAAEPVGTAQLGTIVGITALILVVVQTVKALPILGNASRGFYRMLALGAGIFLAVVAAGSNISSEVVPDLAGDGTFTLLSFWILVVLNGLIAGGAAIGLFDFTRDTINGDNGG